PPRLLLAGQARPELRLDLPARLLLSGREREPARAVPVADGVDLDARADGGHAVAAHAPAVRVRMSVRARNGEGPLERGRVLVEELDQRAAGQRAGTAAEERSRRRVGELHPRLAVEQHQREGDPVEEAARQRPRRVRTGTHVSGLVLSRGRARSSAPRAPLVTVARQELQVVLAGAQAWTLRPSM